MEKVTEKVVVAFFQAAGALPPHTAHDSRYAVNSPPRRENDSPQGAKNPQLP
jgi:hypothetical protein